jgi:hypothetical protein
MPKLSDYAKPAPAEFTLEARLEFAILLIQNLRGVYGKTKHAERIVERIVLKHVTEASAERALYGFTAEQALLLYTLTHA